MVGCARDRHGAGRPRITLIEPRPGCRAEPAALLAALRGRIADWWIPDQIVEIAAMPLAPTGKIDKRRLRDDYSNGRIKAAEPLS